MAKSSVKLTESDVDYIQEVLELCLDYMEHSHVEDMILNKITEAINILEES